VLVIVYHVLRHRRPYTDLDADYFDRLEVQRVERYHISRLWQLGYEVTLTPSQAGSVPCGGFS
jgi:transposase